MFFKQIGRNAAKNRQDNGLFFGSLVVAIIAFYTLLSLESQDVIMFLKTLEGEAVQKLLRFIPIVYLISLFFVFFLVYFAYLYQLESRKREFGLYLILGMTRSRLFTVLMGETVLNSLISILIGLPISLGLTEAISLTISKLIGLSIISHRITFSATAIIWTIVGSVVVQMVAMFFLSFRFTRQEPAELLQSESSKKQEVISQKASWMSLIFGIILLLIAYGIGIAYLRTLLILPTLLIFVFGGTGTFLLYRGLGTFLGHRISKKGTYAKGLYAFTYASSYLTLYIGILFIVIAVTVVGLKFLMQQRISIRRYHTLLKMGASTEELARSARTQIKLFFELVLVVAIISSVFAIWSMFTSFLKLPANTSFTLVLSVSVIAILVLLVLEFAYIKAVERTSNREIANLDLLE